MTYDDRPEKADHHDTEITLSNTTLLLIFLGVAIICGVFFGFGYTMGKRNSAPAVAMVTPKAADVAEVAPPVVAPVVATPAPAETAAEPDAPMSAKPSAAATPVPATSAPVTPAPVVKTVTSPAPAPAPVGKTSPPVVKTTPPPAPAPAPVVAKPVTPVAHPVVTPKPVPAKTAKPVTAPVTTPAAAPASAPSRTYVVQVAAVSRQADADVLVAALRRKGYVVNSYPGTQDNYIHVQVGPFASQKDALAMQSKLSDDGYLAIVK